MEFFFTFVSILTRFCSLVQWQEHQPHEQQQCGECDAKVLFSFSSFSSDSTPFLFLKLIDLIEDCNGM